jgi:Gig2-like
MSAPLSSYPWLILRYIVAFSPYAKEYVPSILFTTIAIAAVSILFKRNTPSSPEPDSATTSSSNSRPWSYYGALVLAIVIIIVIAVQLSLWSRRVELLQLKQDIRSGTFEAAAPNCTVAVSDSLSNSDTSNTPDKAKCMPSHERLEASWQRLQVALNEAVAEVEERGSDIVPAISMKDIEDDKIDHHMRAEIRKRGVVIVRGVVPQSEMKEWHRQVHEYIKAVPESRGFNAQILQLYWAKPQVAARQHRRLAQAKQFLNRLWRYRSDKKMFFDPDRDYAYADRMRVREAHDTSLSLGPHIDNGSIERWQDVGHQLVYRDIFNGEWEKFNAFDAEFRNEAREIMIADGSTFFRTFQGWLAVTAQGEGDGTLQVVPFLREALAYVLLRPLVGDESHTPTFCGTGLGVSQSVTAECHQPLIEALVTIPRVEPGDFVVWHPDLIHAVEPKNSGDSESSVLYVPVSPVCKKNAFYMHSQLQSFLKGQSPPDYPRLHLEQQYAESRASVSMLTDLGRQQMGMDKWDVPPRDDSKHNQDIPLVRELLHQCNDLVKKPTVEAAKPDVP